MKSFLNFFSKQGHPCQESEEEGSDLSGWLLDMDRSGKRVARTENGELKILSGERLHRRRNPPKRENQNLKVRFNKRPGGEVGNPKRREKGKI